MAVNLATKYASKLDQLFTAGSYTDRYVNKKYDFTGAKTVEVYTVTTVDPTNYDRTNTGDRFGGNNELQDVITAYTIGNDKSFKITIDDGNYEQQALAKKAGEVMRAEMEEKVIPMIDANRLNKAAIGAAAVSQYYSPTSNKPYEDVLKLSAALDESKAPQSGRVLWVTPANVPLQGRQGSRGCIPDAPGETGIHLEWKPRTPLEMNACLPGWKAQL